MVEAADYIALWLADATFDSWRRDELLRSGVLNKLANIGEGARALGEELRERYPHVPWSQVVAFRNMAVHEYFGVEWANVWHIAHEDLPALREQVLAVLRSEFPQVADQYEEER